MNQIIKRLLIFAAFFLFTTHSAFAETDSLDFLSKDGEDEFSVVICEEERVGGEGCVVGGVVFEDELPVSLKEMAIGSVIPVSGAVTLSAMNNHLHKILPRAPRWLVSSFVGRLLLYIAGSGVVAGYLLERQSDGSIFFSQSSLSYPPHKSSYKSPHRQLTFSNQGRNFEGLEGGGSNNGGNNQDPSAVEKVAALAAAKLPSTTQLKLGLNQNQQNAITHKDTNLRPRSGKDKKDLESIHSKSSAVSDDYNIDLYVHSRCKSLLKHGSWATVVQGNTQHILLGADSLTTSHQMGMKAVIEGLLCLDPEVTHVNVYIKDESSISEVFYLNAMNNSEKDDLDEFIKNVALLWLAVNETGELSKAYKTAWGHFLVSLLTKNSNLGGMSNSLSQVEKNQLQDFTKTRLRPLVSSVLTIDEKIMLTKLMVNWMKSVFFTPTIATTEELLETFQLSHHDATRLYIFPEPQNSYWKQFEKLLLHELNIHRSTQNPKHLQDTSFDENFSKYTESPFYSNKSQDLWNTLVKLVKEKNVTFIPMSKIPKDSQEYLIFEKAKKFSKKSQELLREY